MKRAKIMLMAILVVATVGGALAFKAQKFGDKTAFCISSITTGVTVCTLTSFKFIPGGATTTQPCKTLHAAVLPLLPASYSTVYFTNSACKTVISGQVVTATNVQ